jgi:hypothetical protein
MGQNKKFKSRVREFFFRTFYLQSSFKLSIKFLKNKNEVGKILTTEEKYSFFIKEIFDSLINQGLRKNCISVQL